LPTHELDFASDTMKVRHGNNRCWRAILFTKCSPKQEKESAFLYDRKSLKVLL
jgi:hypothetical protein